MEYSIRAAVVAGFVVACGLTARGYAESNVPARGDLTIEISGFENSQGQVRAGLFESNDGFPLGVDDLESHVEATIEHGKATVTFESIRHGTYAVVAYHDRNANGTLDKSWLGMPREGAGVYRPIESRFPPPKFDDCAFEFDETNRSVAIELNYL